MGILQGQKRNRTKMERRTINGKSSFQILAILLYLILCSNIHAWSQNLNPLKLKYNTTNTYPEFISNDVLTECFISQCLLYLGTTEQPKGSNWGKDVKDMLNSVGINFPAPWCAAYTGIACRNACITYPYSGFVPNWSRGAWAEKVIFDKSKEKRTVLPSEIRRGDQCTIYFSNLKRDAHIFVVLGVTENGSIISIEGNTNAGGSRDGYGVFIRVRELWQVSKVIRLINN